MEQKIKYVLTDGKMYVTLSNTKRPKMTENETDAFLFKKAAAKNFLTSIPKTLSGIEWKLQPVEEGQIAPPAPLPPGETDALSEESGDGEEAKAAFRQSDIEEETKLGAGGKKSNRRGKSQKEAAQAEEPAQIGLEPQAAGETKLGAEGKESNRQTKSQKGSVQSKEVSVQTKEGLKPQPDSSLCPDGESLEAWVNGVQQRLQQLRARQKELRNEYGHTMLELTDLYHKVELSRFNVVEGYRLCKQLQDCLQRRRSIKNEQEQIDKILSCSFAECANGKLERHFELMKNRQYKPRVLTELFEEGAEGGV